MIGQAQLQAKPLTEFMRTNNAGPLLPFPKEIADKVDNFLHSEHLRSLTATQQNGILLETSTRIGNVGAVVFAMALLPSTLPISFVACAVLSGLAATATLVAGGYLINKERETHIQNFSLLNVSPFFSEIQQEIDKRLDGEAFSKLKERRQLELERSFVARHIAPGKYYALPKRKTEIVYDVVARLNSDGKYYNEWVKREKIEVIPGGWHN